MKLLFIPTLVAAGLFALPAVAGAPLRINFQNASSDTVTQLSVRIAGSKGNAGWTGNQVAGHGLAAGARTWVLLADGANHCVVELQLKTKSGTKFGGTVNLCQNHNFIYHGQS